MDIEGNAEEKQSMPVLDRFTQFTHKYIAYIAGTTIALIIFTVALPILFTNLPSSLQLRLKLDHNNIGQGVSDPFNENYWANDTEIAHVIA